MSAAIRDPGDRDASPDDAAVVHPHGSFFGRRKGHRLRSHQADLIEHLLPRLSLKIDGSHSPDLAGLFDAPVDDIRLEI
jgi:tRNA (guanine-N7-)-methyltransferase